MVTIKFFQIFVVVLVEFAACLGFAESMEQRKGYIKAGVLFTLISLAVYFSILDILGG